MKTLVLYDKRFPSVFVDEFLHPEKVSEESYVKHPNANKREIIIIKGITSQQKY